MNCLGKERSFRVPLDDQHGVLVKDLPLPSPFTYFREWKDDKIDGKFRVGSVLAIVREPDNNTFVRIFFDAGRRRSVNGVENGIVLESNRLKIERLVKLGIRIHDWVQTDYMHWRVWKILSREEVEETGLQYNVNSFDWSKVVGSMLD